MENSTDPNPELSHIQQQILQLAENVHRIQHGLGELSVRLREDSIQINALIRHLSDTQSTQLLQERLADFSEQMNADHEQLNYVTGQLNHLATQEQLVRLATQVATQEKLTELATTLERLSRAQHRANLLAETKEQQLESALATLQEIVDQRARLDQQTESQARAEHEQTRRAARGELAVDLLPAVDMFENMLAQGQAMLDKRRAEFSALSAVAPPETNQPSTQSGGSFFSKLRARVGGDMDAETAGTLRKLPDSMQAHLEELEEWTRNIGLLRDRFLGVLRNEGIEPIVAVQQLFDPHVHLAVGSEPRTDVAPQTVIREVRKGYRQGARTLRHSEVIVAHRPGSKPAPSPAPGGPARSGS